MTTFSLIEPPAPPHAGHPSSDAPADVRSADSDRLSVREMLDEIIPLIGVVPVAGPPAVFIAGPWLLFGLMLAAPFALLVTMVLAVVAAIALAGIAAAVLASPYFLFRHLHARWTARVPAPVRVREPRLLPARRVAA